MQQSLAPAISNTEAMPGVHLIWLDAPALAAAARPGQFVMVGCGEDTLLRRPFSIHRIDDGKLALLFNIVGKGTYWLSRREPGDDIDLFGPLGNAFSIPKTAKKILLVAGGMGIAPLVFLADEAARLGYDTDFLVGTPAGTPSIPDGLPPEIFAFITEDGSSGNKGMVTDLLREGDYRQADVIYACGPLPMYQAMAQMPELKDRPVQVSLEVVMGCGLGICYGCTVKTRNGLRQVCRDGPVFNLADILWDELAPVRGGETGATVK